jgi:hypothetical protein
MRCAGRGSRSCRISNILSSPISQKRNIVNDTINQIHVRYKFNISCLECVYIYAEEVLLFIFYSCDTFIHY